MTRAKYGNRKVERFGHTFDSVKEANRYLVLLGMEQAGEIAGLTLQPKFEIMPGFRDWDNTWIRPTTYSADFQYRDKEGNLIIEDVKSAYTKTQQWAIKWKLLKYSFRHTTSVRCCVVE